MTRAEEAALKAYPHLEQATFDETYPRLLFTRNTERNAFVQGYEQGQKETIDRAVEWLKENWREYVWITDDNIPHFGHWEKDLRKALEEE